MKLFLMGLMLSSFAFATSNDLSHRPKSFNIDSGKAVFVDFTEAVYDIEYDIANKKASAVATIRFNAPEAGLPIFDAVTEPASIKLDGTYVTAQPRKTPNNETTLRVIEKEIKTGSHTLIIEIPITTLVEFKDGGVKSAFWTSDLDERRFLERYLPANFEFDQVKMTFNISYKGNTLPQQLYTNGTVTKTAAGYKVVYPSYYTSSSIFFHTVPQGAVDEISYSLKSIDGREIPVVIYVSKSMFSNNASTLNRFKNSTTEIFHELEKDYGAFMHPSIVVYNAGMGGMEYCGATMTDFSALGHELFHSYFARGVMPANGNAGWLDEALASWRDSGYQIAPSLSGTSRMSNRPYYTRTTDKAAYSFGDRFMRFMHWKLNEKGGLKPFMRHMVENRKFSPLFVEDFIKEMNEFYGMKFDLDFDRYTYSTKENFDQNTLKSMNHPAHQKMSIEELQQHL